MGIGRSLIVATALFAPVALSAAPVQIVSRAPAPSTVTAPTAAPPSLTSAAALMAKAFRPKPESCDAFAPGAAPLLAPAQTNQVMCIYSPFTRTLWGHCPAFPASPVPALPNGGPPPNQQPAFIVGDQVDGVQSGVSKITGHVQLDQGSRRVTAQEMTYDSATGLADARHDVSYATPGLVLSAPTGQYDTNKGTGTFQQTDFLMPLRHGHGTADVFNSLDDAHSLLFGVQYTTCPPGKMDWSLNAPDLRLDTSTNTGVAHDVTIDFLGVPIFWSPYLNFPITDDRKSGFLGTEFSFDVTDGFEMGAPYYLNLADNYDATLYPRIITKRGVQLGGEFRYLTEYNSGTIYASYLPHDQLEGGERGQLALRHDTKFNDFNNMDVNYNWVSDDNFFEDLGTNASNVSTVSLERHVRYTYDDEEDWDSTTQFQDYQIVDPFIKPYNYTYRRLPQTVLTWANNDDYSGPMYGFYAEAVRFQRDLRIGAWRTDVKPSISLPFSDAAGYLTPSLAWRVTDYDLQQQDFVSDTNSGILAPSRHESRVTPIFSLDTGLYFDRDAGDHIDTLEPRLYYLRVPYRDQNALPIFDTVLPQFSYQQLFTDDQFVGGDRQSDADQLSYGITGRILDATTGGQILQWDLGQAHYYADRRVQIDPTIAPQTTRFSEVAGDVLYDLNDEWRATYDQLWNPYTRQSDLGSVILEYHPAYHQVVDVGYQYRRPNLQQADIKQTDFAYDWPLSDNWSMVGRWNYDIIHHVTIEDLVGFEYDTCCWDFQILHQHYVTPTRQFDNVIFFNLELKGLVNAGRHLESVLQRGILGYSDNDFDVPQPPDQPTQ